MIKLNELKQQYKFKKSDIQNGQLKSPDAHLEECKERYVYFMEEINEIYQWYLNKVNINSNSFRFKAFNNA